MGGPEPTHPLAEIQAAVRRGAFRIRDEAVRTAGEVLCDVADIGDCLLELTARDFHKTMESRKRPGLWQDVYKTHHHGFPIYTKVQMTERGVAYVISFKLDEDP